MFCSSCQSENNYFLLNCDPLVNSKQNDLTKWQFDIFENEDNLVKIYFDTILFDQKDIVNTISITRYNEIIDNNFSFEKFINSKFVSMKNQSSIELKGNYFDNGIKHSWFLVNDTSELFSYVEYGIIGNILIEYTLVSSDKHNYLQDICDLNKIGYHLKSEVYQNHNASQNKNKNKM